MNAQKVTTFEELCRGSLTQLRGAVAFPMYSAHILFRWALFKEMASLGKAAENAEINVNHLGGV